MSERPRFINEKCKQIAACDIFVNYADKRLSLSEYLKLHRPRPLTAVEQEAEHPEEDECT